MKTNDEINIDHLVRSRRKSIGLMVRDDAALEVRAPLKASMKYIWEVVEKNREWILDKQHEARKFSHFSTPKQFTEGEEFFYLGHPSPLRIETDAKAPFYHNGSEFIIAARYANAARDFFEEWYRERAARYFRERAEFFASTHDLEFSSIKINSANRQWGSCSVRKTLNFSWRLLMAPPDIIDYVIVHELAHLKELNHSRRFWLEVEAMLPGYRHAKAWLRKNGRMFKGF